LVDVREYFRRDGTRVRAHTRSAPTVAAVGGGVGVGGLVFLAILWGCATGGITVSGPGITPPPNASPSAHAHHGSAHGGH
jgi:hypothetical protein